jgi:hypothetical protein
MSSFFDHNTGTITSPDIAHQRRFHNQHLSATTLKSPKEVVGYLGMVQAQDYSDGKWAVGQPLKGATDGILEKAFTNGEVLRSHLLRLSWHIVKMSENLQTPNRRFLFII